MKPSEILTKAAGLIEPEGSWVQGAAVTNRRGLPVSYADAECFCLFGAVRVASGAECGDLQFEEAWDALCRVPFPHLSGPIEWNDEPGRTKSEVVAKLREAAALAAAEGQ